MMTVPRFSAFSAFSALTALALVAVPLSQAQHPNDIVTESPPSSQNQEQLELQDFVYIPGGTFTCGDPEDISFGNPKHDVKTHGYYLQQKEVTKSQWDEVRLWGLQHGYTDLPGGEGKASDHPVQKASWHDVVKWCNAKSEMESLGPMYYTDTGQTTVYRIGIADLDKTMVKQSANGYRLPTEWEWEKAARGGLDGKNFPWGDTISHREANFNNDARENYQTGTKGLHPTYKKGYKPYTSPVGSFAPNGYGLYDMSGNVAEWCWDRYPKPSSTLQPDPQKAAKVAFRSIRGGSWFGAAHYCLVWYRNVNIATFACHDLGFRLARSSAIGGGRLAPPDLNANKPQTAEDGGGQPATRPESK